MHTALLLLPDFSLILLGVAIRRWMHLGDHFWNGVEKLVYFILFPALLVSALIKTRIDLGAALPLLATAFVAMAGGMLLGLLPKLVVRLPALTYASLFQCGYRFNSYIALAVAGMLFGAPGIATMGLIVGAAVPVANSTAAAAAAAVVAVKVRLAGRSSGAWAPMKQTTTGLSMVPAAFSTVAATVSAGGLDSSTITAVCGSAASMDRPSSIMMPPTASLRSRPPTPISWLMPEPRAST